MNKVENFISYAYIIIVAFFLTIFFDLGFFNFIHTKKEWYYVLGVIVLFVVAILLIIEVIKQIIEFGFRSIIQNMNLLDIAVLLLGVTAFFSSIFSKESFVTSWHGSNGEYVGAFIYILICVLYFFISRTLDYKEKVIWTIIISSACIVTMYYLLYTMDRDFFNVKKVIFNQEYRDIMASAFHYNEGYISVIVPIFMYRYITDSIREYKNKVTFYLMQVVYNLALFLSYCMVYIGPGDGKFMGIIPCLFIMLFYISTDISKVKKFFICFINFSLAGAFSKILLFDNGFEIIDGVKKYDAYTVLIDKNVFIYIGLVSLIIVLVIIFLEKKRDNSNVTAIAIVKVLDKTQNANKSKSLFIIGLLELVTFAGSFIAYLIHCIKLFSDDWGGYSRGFLWRHAIKVFKQFSIREKIIGYGPSGFGSIVYKLFDEEMKKVYKLPVLDTCNEFLEYLVDLGIIGVVAYFLIWVGLIKRIIKERKKINKGLIAYFGALAYLGQSFGYSQSVYGLLFLFLLLAIGRNVTYKPQKVGQNRLKKSVDIVINETWYTGGNQ